MRSIASALVATTLLAGSLLVSQEQSATHATGIPLFGDGSDGAITIATNQAFNPPADAIVDAGTASTSTLTVSGVSGTFLPGQRILIHQTRGTSAGAWELNAVSSFALGNLSTSVPLANSYFSGGNDAAQVLVLPQFTNVTINNGVTVTAKPWNGSTGGILAFFASGTLTLNGTLSSSALGYRGPTGSTSDAGVQGEGTDGPGSHVSGPNGNGGAVVVGCQGSGGGGGHASAGTNSTAGQCQTVGGLSAGSADLTEMVFGGAGGPGNEGPGNPGSTSGNGGNGGGIVFLNVATLTATGTISSNGATGTTGTPGSGGVNNSNGGGGAGGSILLRVQSATLGSSVVQAEGGQGGDSSDGHGGDGSDGRIRAEYCVSISGGAANPPASIEQLACAGAIDTDTDGCLDKFEQQTEVGSETSGGRRDYLNGNDYFNPSHDGQNRVDDIVLVLQAYFKDDNDANPGLPPYEPGYNPDTDRTLVGPNLWNLGPPNGLQRVDDIVNILNHYFHDC